MNVIEVMDVFAAIGVIVVLALALLTAWVLAAVFFGNYCEITFTGGSKAVTYRRGRWPWQWHRVESSDGY